MVWWLVIFFSNYFFLFIIVGSFSLIYYFILYFFFQEFLGFLLVYSFRDWMFFFVLSLKRGLGFFFIWFLFLVNQIVGYIFFVFNFLMKLIYIPILLNFVNSSFDWYFFFSVMVVFFFQVFFKGNKFLFFLNSRETFTVFFLGFSLSFLDLFFIFFIYFIIFFLVWSDLEDFMDFEKLFFFVGLPLNLVFFLKSLIFFLLAEKSFFILFMIFYSFFRILSQFDFFFQTKIDFIKTGSLLGLFYFFFFLLDWFIIFLLFQFDELKIYWLFFSYLFLVRESSWPLLISWVLNRFFSSFLVFCKFGYYFSLLLRFFILVFILVVWTKDVYCEGLSGFHSFQVQGAFKVVFYYFILREVMFFFGMFWFLFDVSLVPSTDLGENWLPEGVSSINPFGVPFLNSFILLSRAVSLTWRHYNFLEGKSCFFSLFFTIILGFLFLLVQLVEYRNIRFSFRDSSFGSIFFMLTGFHGFHVFLGFLFLLKNFFRLRQSQVSFFHCLSFEFSILYWHFVDFVWLFVFLSLYLWGSN